MRSAAQRLQRLAYTLRHLRMAQAYFYAVRRALPARSVRDDTEPVVNETFRLAPPLAAAPSRLPDGRFRFLNVTGPCGARPDWNPEGYSRLWRYNLHYFDYLRQPGLASRDAEELVAAWIADNAQGSRPGWEPFTVSLRIVNWLFAGAARPAILGPVARRSLYLQARWLYQNDERHIRANHYFENLKALAFAGAFFRGKEPQRWLSRATEALREQLIEQMLPDGAHYERSPQYHALMLENCLDLINLAQHNAARFSDGFVAQLRDTARRGLDWLNDVVFPDGQIPLFNDSALGIAPTAEELTDYARGLFGYEPAAVPDGVRLIDKDAAGLFGVRSGADMILMDCGDIGPDYQPGHTHCDFLSYELALGGQRVVVDAGVCGYEPGAKRDYVRSTRAHNTVVVDGDEQSEVWGAFRLGRRARRLQAGVARLGLGTAERGASIEIRGGFCGFFRGAWGARPRFQVERAIMVELDDAGICAFEVADAVQGLGRRSPDQHRLESLVHLHPSIAAAPLGAGAVAIADRAGGRIGVLRIPPECRYAVETTSYHPQFGVDQPNDCIVLTRHARLPSSISYRFTRALADPACAPDGRAGGRG